MASTIRRCVRWDVSPSKISSVPLEQTRIKMSRNNACEGDLRSYDSPDSTNSDNISTCHGAHSWSCRVVDGPGQEPRPARERPDRDEIDAHIPNVGIRLPPEDGKPNDGQQREGTQVSSPPVGLITRVGNSNSHDAGTDIGRDTVQLGLCVGPIEVAQDGGQEDGKALDGDVDEEEAEATGVVVDVRDGAADMGERDFLVGVCAVLADEALGCDRLLALREELAGRG